MKLLRLYLLFVLLNLIAACSAKAQIIVQTWVDPCTNQVQSATFPINGPGVVIMYRGQVKVFTATQAAAGDLMAWINKITVSVPCPVINNPVITQSATQAATQAASQAASSAASAAASSAASSAASGAASSAASSSSGAAASGAATSAAATPPPTPTSPPPSSSSSPPPSSGSGGGDPPPSSSSSGGSSSGSSSSGGSSGGDTKTETKSETKSESKSESKSDEKKSDEKKEDKKKEEARTNPIMVASDLSIAQQASGGPAEIITVGVSQSSLMGDKSYGATGMLWSTFDQGALSLSYTKMNFKKGKLNSISSYSFTSAYLKGILMEMAGYTWVKPHPKFGVYGVSLGAIGLFTPNGEHLVITDSAKIVQQMMGYGVSNYIYKSSDTLLIDTHGYNSSWATSAVVFWMHPPIVVNPRLTVSPQVFVIASPLSYNTLTGFTKSDKVGEMIGSSFDYKLTKRFGATAAWRVMFSDGQKPMNTLLIGSRLIL
jgi:hypothetical protein